MNGRATAAMSVRSSAVSVHSRRAGERPGDLERKRECDLAGQRRLDQRHVGFKA